MPGGTVYTDNHGAGNGKTRRTVGSATLAGVAVAVPSPPVMRAPTPCVARPLAPLDRTLAANTTGRSNRYRHVLALVPSARHGPRSASRAPSSLRDRTPRSSTSAIALRLSALRSGGRPVRCCGGNINLLALWAALRAGVTRERQWHMTITAALRLAGVWRGITASPLASAQLQPPAAHRRA